MKRVLLCATMLVVGAVMSLSCNRDLPVVDSQGGGPAIAAEMPGQRTLHMLWTRDEAAEHVVLRWQVGDLSGGATLSGVPEGWAAGDMFEIAIPPHAIGPVPGGEIRLVVPERQIDPLFGTAYPAIYRLEPDLCFDERVTVTLRYPDWLPLPPGGLYPKFCFWQIGDTTYGVSDFDYLETDERDDRKVSFTTDHFSRWSLDDGDL